jgi:Phage late-transcription coactivator
MSVKKKEKLIMTFGLTVEQLVQDIDDIVHRNRMNYIDAIVFYCEKNNFDVESLAKLIPSSLRSKVEESARQTKMLKKQYYNISTLPI